MEESRHSTVDMPSDLRQPMVPFDYDLQPVTRHSRGVVKLTVESTPSSRPLDPDRPHPRWRTPEFLFYASLFVIVVPIMVWVPVSLSSPSHPNYSIFSRRLSAGWIPGRQVDNSDAQYRTFRSNLPILVCLAGVFFGVRFIYTRSFLRATTASPTDYLNRMIFYLAFSTIMLLGLHGSSTIKIFVILGLNYGIARSFRGSKLNPILTWAFNIAVLIANEKNAGHRFGDVHNSFAFLDSLTGVDPRWYIRFNITMLRLISFNMDYYWANKKTGMIDSGSTLTEKQRSQTFHSLDVYSFINYVVYALYPPLFIAGPIITFNDFMWQIQRPLQIEAKSTVMYLVRFLACLLTMELILHYMYVVAIKDSSAWAGDSPFELSMIGFWNLIIVWLKLLIPWRFFRLWSLADGISPPENMIRCMANNYSAFGFWRSWHRSYNLWIVRYIHIPLGGSNNVVFSTILVFSFVALWHDLSFRLLAWGWLVSLFVLPELVARYIFPAKKYGMKVWYRHLCAVGGVGNILMMMGANLVGFVVGVDGVSYLVQQLTGSWQGIWFLFVASCALFVAVQVMFEYREEEMRQGIYRRC